MTASEADLPPVRIDDLSHVGFPPGVRWRGSEGAMDTVTTEKLLDCRASSRIGERTRPSARC